MASSALQPCRPSHPYRDRMPPQQQPLLLLHIPPTSPSSPAHPNPSLDSFHGFSSGFLPLTTIPPPPISSSSSSSFCCALQAPPPQSSLDIPMASAPIHSSCFAHQNSDTSSSFESSSCFESSFSTDDSEEEEEEETLSPSPSSSQSPKSSPLPSLSSSSLSQTLASSFLSRKDENGPLTSLHSLSTALPVKRGLSRYFSGKAQSFSCVAHVNSIADLAKPENPFIITVKRRRTGTSKKNSKNIMYHSSTDSHDHAEADDEEEKEEEEEEEDNHHHHRHIIHHSIHHSYPPRKPAMNLQAKLHRPSSQTNYSQVARNNSNNKIKPLSSKCFSVPELQET